MGHKVLLADDSITVQKIVKLSLTEEGIEVIAVGNGEQAIQQLETMRPDLVMADVFMPGKDGYEVCEFVKAQPHLKNIPVILLVHAFEPFDPDRARKVGADHQLTKPFQSIRTLVATVRDLLQVQAEAASISPHPALLSSVPTETPVEASPVLTPVLSQTVVKQPEEEFAMVSSLTSAVNSQAESEFSLDVNSMPGFELPSPSTAFTPAAMMPEAGLPVPMNTGSGMAKADILPPPELSVLSQTQWQPSPQAEWQAAPVLTNISQPEPLSSAFAPLSLVPDMPVMDSPAMLATTDDVLELADVLLPATGVAPLASVSPQATPMTSDMSLLAVMGTPIPTEEVPSDTFPAESRPTTFAGSFDIAAGQVSLQSDLPLIAQADSVQDVSVGTVSDSGSAVTAVEHIPEAVIEEIVNRVIQRLSTKAIQEIAWEVVPEMAELLIRKQISQQKQLTH
jgi:CheY-like chemotaxis protein